MKIKSEYDKQAEKFLQDTGTTIKAEYQGHRKYFPGDGCQRAVYEITLEREGHAPYSFSFGQSLSDSYSWSRGQEAIFSRRCCSEPHGIKNINKLRDSGESFWFKGWNYQAKPVKAAPSAYDVLACIEKSEPMTFEEFCDNYGYNSDSIADEKTYKAVLDQQIHINRIFADCMDELQEIN